MSHPPFWLTKQFFYPIGNTGAVSLTQDLSPEQSSADILLLGCGDPRNILFTLYSDLIVGQGSRRLDITCCDHEPAILARNVLLFSLLEQNENIDRIWDTFYHFKINDRALRVITSHSQVLYDSAEDIETWQKSRFGSFLEMADTRTLSELRRLWKSYADFPRLPADRKNRIAKEQIQLSNSVGDAGSVAMSQSRSAGMLWPQAMEPVAKLFRKYWETGTTFSLASEIKSATNLNPTFIYSLSGEGFNPHYGTFPCGFHLITGFAPIKSDPAGPPPSTGSAAINTSKQQFAAWCRAFQKSLSAKSLTIRFFAGDALQFCRALDQYRTTGDPSTDLFVSAYRATQINFYRPAIDGTIPMVFDVIDTSNLTDHLGLFNLLLVAHGLLKDIPHTQAVLYTETLIPSGRDATKSFLDRILTDVPTLSMLFGIAPRPYVSNFTTHCNAHEVIFTELKAQYHERVAWSDPSGGDNLLQTLKARTISFEADSLARILYSIYDNMFAAEKIGAMMSSMALNPNSMIDFSKVHFQRETVALLFQVVQRRVHLCSGDWEQVVMKFFAMCTSAGGRIIESNCFQDLCLQLHLHGVYTVDTLKPDWASNPEFRFSPHSDLFNSWSSTPPVVCVVLTVPRQRLGVFFETPEKIGSPTLQAGLWTPDTHDNLYSAIYLSWGKCVTPNSSDHVLIEEDPSGQNGKSDLVVSFWASSRLTEIPGTQVSLRIKSTPQSTFAFMSKLGMSLDVFHASIMDKKYVHVLPYRPGLSSNLSQNPPLRPARMSATSIVGPVCHAIASNSQSQGVDSLSIRFDVTTKSEQEKLQNGAQVSANQVSACVMELKVGDHSHMLSYPYPIHGKNNRLRIARKSHYVEVVVPVSTPNDYSGYFLNAAPIINPGAYTTWNIHHVNLDRLPDLDDRVPEKLGWLNTLTVLQLSEREKDIRNGEETHKNAAINALVNVKDSIHAITMNASGVQGVHTRTIGLCEPNQGGVYVLFLIGGIKLDSACSSIVLDTAVVPLSNDRMPALVRGIQNMQNKGTLAQINTVGHEVGAWKRLIPAFIERSRNWDHRPKCEYKSKGKVPLSIAYDENPVCTCGEGIGFKSLQWNAPEWQGLLPFATRAAICPIFAVPYIERVAGNWSEHHGAPGSKPTNVCWACGGPGTPKLSACSRCKKARYCSTTCQRQDWKVHKGTCKPE